MIIHNDVQLDFDDVLIAPQTTTINHRGDVEIVREYKHLGVCGVPIISANMPFQRNCKSLGLRTSSTTFTRNRLTSLSKAFS